MAEPTSMAELEAPEWPSPLDSGAVIIAVIAGGFLAFFFCMQAYIHEPSTLRGSALDLYWRILRIGAWSQLVGCVAGYAVWRRKRGVLYGSTFVTVLLLVLLALTAF